MTKEELIEKINNCTHWEDVRPIIEKLYEQNVVIPKGGTLQAKFKAGWGDVLEISDKYEYRIKPSEPVYEWQWYSIANGCVSDSTDTWLDKKWRTEEEIRTYGGQWYKYEETKRERKQ